MAFDESNTEFRISYEGVALQAHTMDVKDLAPALIAFGELFTRANTLLNSKDVSVSLKVRATQPGSFELLLLLTNVYHTTTQFLSSDMVTSATTLFNIVTGVPKVGDSLFKVIKKLKGRKPQVIQYKDGFYLKADNIEIRISEEVLKVFQDNETKRLAQSVVEPLYRDGIDRMVIKDNKKQIDIIDKDDTPSFTFDNIPVEGGTENINPKVYLRVINPNLDFLKNKKWRLDDGAGSKWYTIEDQNFLNSVKDFKRRFGAGDYLVCRVRTIQRVNEDKLEIERSILAVLDHVTGGQQLPLTNITKNN